MIALKIKDGQTVSDRWLHSPKCNVLVTEKVVQDPKNPETP